MPISEPVRRTSKDRDLRDGWSYRRLASHHYCRHSPQRIRDSEAIHPLVQGFLFSAAFFSSLSASCARPAGIRTSTGWGSPAADRAPPRPKWPGNSGLSALIVLQRSCFLRTDLLSNCALRPPSFPSCRTGRARPASRPDMSSHRGGPCQQRESGEHDRRIHRDSSFIDHDASPSLLDCRSCLVAPISRNRRFVAREAYLVSSRHWALTVSRPSANVTLIILRVANLVGRLSHLVSAMRGPFFTLAISPAHPGSSFTPTTSPGCFTTDCPGRCLFPGHASRTSNILLSR